MGLLWRFSWMGVEVGQTRCGRVPDRELQLNVASDDRGEGERRWWGRELQDVKQPTSGDSLMIEHGPPKRVVAEVCIPDGEGGEICARARESLEDGGTGRAWVDCRSRARKLAKAARAGQEGVVICARCGTNVVVQDEREIVVCPECRSETTEDREMARERAFEADRHQF